ncbi:uncharacterized protein LOC131004918 [Salvia miltiorrhiza]|uniref:uncharacterized protein LOC131004918 n=1 Tax=Salvia miltiorrhiza TaxID=226208 RepID=UPI0025AC587E|nr:uncharacterized protein LOC131004918 [Salvia miltiorrhiza]
MEANYSVLCGSYGVRTTVTAKASVVRRWVYNIRYRHRFRLRLRRLVVGLGVQWVPGHDFSATLQLCVGTNCLIFQIDRARHCPAILRRFLVHPDVILVGLWNRMDAGMLIRSRHAVKVGRLVDVRNVANDFMGCHLGASTGQLAEDILGMHGMYKDELVGRSDWNAETLNGEQVKYACHDVFLAFLMAKKLRVWNWEDYD